MGTYVVSITFCIRRYVRVIWKHCLKSTVSYILWDVAVSFMSGCNSGCHAAFMRAAEYCKRTLRHLSESTQFCWPICYFERLNLKLIIANTMEQNGRLPDGVHGNSFLFNCYLLVTKQQNTAVCFSFPPSEGNTYKTITPFVSTIQTFGCVFWLLSSG
jgi:hypothetical protein